MRPMNPLGARGLLAVTGALGSIAVAPAMAQTPAPASPGSSTTTPTSTRPATRARSALKLRSVRHNVTLGTRVLATGTLRPTRSGRHVRLQVHGASEWHTVSVDTTSRRGSWRLRYTPSRPASLRLRVVFGGDATTRPARRSLGRVNVFRRALVSWYGPGLYGNSLACGGRLSPATLGVANKSLPCGTLVTLRHRGRSVRVRVVDRGPYVGAREFDLTGATRARLGFSGTGTVLSTR